jgi:PKD repeat protein
MASASTGPFFATQMAVYTGSSLEGLTEVACLGTWSYSQTLPFHADAGATYHVQVGPLAFGSTGTISFSFGVTPLPGVSLGFSPGDPSVFDTIQFSGYASDPANAGITAWSWDFGDGSTATTQNPTHRYAADGDYTVRVGVETDDGRVASYSSVVSVVTHDVAIAKLTVPSAVSSGQTRQITVGVSNWRYPETVAVRLFKGSLSGWELIGSLTQQVLVRGANRTTPFSFSYTFTSGDTAYGKVTFKAEASIQGFRDALPADNTAIAMPTKVNK